MPNALLMHKDDKLGSGQTIFVNTGVEYGDDGIKGLLHYVPLAQGDWELYAEGSHHEHSKVYDDATSRLLEHVEAVQSGTLSSFLRKRIVLPRDLGAFPDDCLRIITYRSGSIQALKARFHRAGGTDTAINGVSISPASDTTYEQFLMRPVTFYMPGDFVTLEVEFQSDTAGEFIRIGDVELLYKSGRGNI